ncbi:MAG: exodeoxyribonuclease V subunit gamma [Deltaproteobacteria bacterium]
MGALRLFTSNRLEIMAEALGEVLREPPASPFDHEIIIVQSKGMERWLSMQLAAHQGICANCRFPFPNAFVRDIFRKVLKHVPERSVFEPQVMTWRIMKVLPSLMEKQGFEDIRLYLGEARDGMKLFQLCERIADAYDQYVVFRPEMIFRWEKGEDEHWQGSLWRELKEEGGATHRAALARAFFHALTSGSVKEEAFPNRVSVFGISALPRFHMEVLAALSRYVEVNLFLMNPCREYWGDILSSWEMQRRVGREKKVIQEVHHVERGNSLLASMGALGRDFFDLTSEFNCEEFPVFHEPGEGSLLCCIQSDILNLRDRSWGSTGKKRLSPDDDSIQIHSCHSPMREIEALHDQLLRMFEDIPDLMPKDILVMMPDVETYAPYVQAVFDLPPDDPRHIPFSIADRSVRQESGIVETFLSLVRLQAGRFGASEVLALLESDPIRYKLAFTEGDAERVRRWVRETNIRWGIDGPDRSQMGLPPFPENTWRAGLARLLIGYAMPGEEEKMFGPVLPYDHVEGEDTRILGSFVEFAENLFGHVQHLAEPRTLSGWSEMLTRSLDRFFVPDESTEREIQVLRRCLHDLVTMQESARFDVPVDVSVILNYLVDTLDKQGFGFGFMTGGVTFCAMLPMRSIPFSVICLVGMNSDAYPRQSKPLSFDLIAGAPRRGDRSRRHDDRYLFLEALLSARERLYISHVGQSIMDNSAIPPSVLVSELMDYIEQGFEIPGMPVADHVVARHRLQGFSTAYFKKEEKLFSYSEERCHVARGLLQPPEEPEPFLSEELSEPEEESRTVDIDDLCRFFSNPARFLLDRRLRIYLEGATIIPGDREPFEIRGLDRYVLEQKLLAKLLAGAHVDDFLSLNRASGHLPHGTVGECLFQDIAEGVESFVSKLTPHLEGGPLEPLEINLAVSEFNLTGRVDGIYSKGLIQYRYARLKSRDLLRAWIYHLVLNGQSVKDYPRCTLLAGLEASRTGERRWLAWHFTPVTRSDGILYNLLCRYWEGLKRPLPFFPDSSWVYAKDRIERETPADQALQKARARWEGGPYNRGEREDLYYQQCFGQRDCLDRAFQMVSEEIFRPMVAHMEKKQPGF